MSEHAWITPNTVLDECGSTNDLIRDLGERGAPTGTWISARRQTAGRGRLGRSWVSEPGNLFLSYLVRPREKSVTSWIPLVAGLAAFDAILSLRPLPNLRLKWPNDLWIGDQKLGGILCEGVSSAQGVFVGVGIGINGSTSPELVDRRTASLGMQPAEVDLLRARLVEQLNERFHLLIGDSPDLEHVRLDYLDRSLFTLESQVFWGNQLEFSGVCCGLGASGELLVRLASGQVTALFAEEVSPRPAPKASS